MPQPTTFAGKHVMSVAISAEEHAFLSVLARDLHKPIDAVLLMLMRAGVEAMRKEYGFGPAKEGG